MRIYDISDILMFSVVRKKDAFYKRINVNDMAVLLFLRHYRRKLMKIISRNNMFRIYILIGRCFFVGPLSEIYNIFGISSSGYIVKIGTNGISIFARLF